ncbi:isoquinoline 1-oxidoreductase subunit beta [Actinomycetospora sp. NBRC 106375]|uniref:molybdopterin cofactor-binding domain-containing protein n=1 Tax=Actinomycetospora sp. NBRC 106375 TaxID=3032207 RepID=UPI0024A1323B|nr:molybdopterin cofactor-binding domain-containing protein [Actinomycetospora sp. NBRC 106375]GLZ46698.1 isoquinoline 1-oxidoreductase subunit beta [Actinomycetospora sp. NBRC 106375]
MPAQHRVAPRPPRFPGTSRRQFLGYLLAAPTLAVGVKLTADSVLEAEALPSPAPEVSEVYDLSDLLADSTRPTANLITVVLERDGTVSFSMPRAESGQGITTMAAMLIAEEMGIPVSDVNVTLADARPELLFNQQTQGSSTVISIYTPIRVAAALARGRLLEAASTLLGDEATNLRTTGGKVVSEAGSSIPFAQLATAAANSETREALTELKGPDDFTVIGTPQRRDDVRAAVTGKKNYTMDIDVPGAVPTMIARPPTIKGTVESINNEDQVRSMPGVTDVVEISTDAAPGRGTTSSGVAVCARTFGQCIDAINALDITWGGGNADGESDESILRQLRASPAPVNLPSPTPLDQVGGQIPLATEGLGNVGPVEAVEQEFVFHWRSNSAMEPNVAVADVRSDSAEVWTPSQIPINTQDQLARELDLTTGQVTVHVTRGGGAFGRRLFNDAPLEAARVSKEVGKPVKLMWHRADECRVGRVHPMCISRLRATYSPGAKQVVSFEQRHTSVATDYTEAFGDMISSQAAKLPFANELTLSQTVFLLTASVPYDVGAVALGYNEIFDFDKFATGSSRNLNNMDVRPAQELMIDLLAAKLDEDPLDFRLDRLESDRAKAVLEKVRDEGDWGRDLPEGVAQGVAVHNEYKGTVAVLAEVDTRPATANRDIRGATTGPRVRKVTVAVDVGLPINPLGLKAQMEGGVMTGIAHVFTGSLHLRDGNFLEGSWDDYRYTRHWNSPPELDVHVMPATGERPGGAGELGVGVSVAAVACAYARATGTTPTSFPIGHTKDVPFRVKPFVPPLPPSPEDGLTSYPTPSAAGPVFNPAS